jgi:hypothetical protein
MEPQPNQQWKTVTDYPESASLLYGMIVTVTAVEDRFVNYYDNLTGRVWVATPENFPQNFRYIGESNG